MNRIFMRHRADDGQLICDPGDLRQSFADPQAWQRGIDRFHLSLNFHGSQWFGVKSFVLGGRAKQKDKDACFGSGGSACRAG